MENTWPRPDGFEEVIELMVIQMAYISETGPFTKNPSGLFIENALKMTGNDGSMSTER